MEKVAATLLLCKLISRTNATHDLSVDNYVHTVLYSTSAQQEQCGSIGNSDETAATPSRAQMFYLDTDNAAPCTGNVTSWRVCYYGPDSVNGRGSYWATYAVYRMMGSGDSVRYIRVSGMFSAVRTIESFVSVDPVADGEITEGGFNCYDDAIDSPLTILAGDILGACVFDPSNGFGVTRIQLDVVGETSGGTLLQRATTGCSREDIPSDIAADQLSSINSRRLHVYAMIGKLC